jgi:light-independent protochlorophyllide reductase subunit B
MQSGNPEKEEPTTKTQDATKVKKVVELTWAPDAQKTLKQIPFFVRPKVQKQVEDYARANGHSLITLDLLHEVKNKTH